MKTELTIISDDLNHGIIDEDKARTLLLGLLGVSHRFWTVEEIVVELESLDAFKEAKYFFERYGD